MALSPTRGHPASHLRASSPPTGTTSPLPWLSLGGPQAPTTSLGKFQQRGAGHVLLSQALSLSRLCSPSQRLAL